MPIRKWSDERMKVLASQDSVGWRENKYGEHQQARLYFSHTFDH